MTLITSLKLIKILYQTLIYECTKNGLMMPSSIKNLIIRVKTVAFKEVLQTIALTIA